MGHPAKEGLRPAYARVMCNECLPRVGHPAKEGLRLKNVLDNDVNYNGPEWVIQQKRD